MVERVVRAAVAPNRRNLAAAAAVAGLLAAGYWLVTDPVVRYGVWLAVFSVWMGWFVLVVVEVIRADESAPG